MPTERPEWVLTRRREIGHHIAALRADRGMSVDDLAAAPGLDRKSIMRTEHGARSVGIDVLLLLAHGLGVPAGSLLDASDPAAGSRAADGGA